MHKTASFTVLGEPQSKARPRFNTFTKTTYTPAKTQAYENKVRQAYIESCGDCKLTGEIEAYLYFYFPIPKSKSKKFKQQASALEFGCTNKKDLDNLEKTVLDALNGLAYDDDHQITLLHAEKWYAEQPRVEVVLMERKIE